MLDKIIGVALCALGGVLVLGSKKLLKVFRRPAGDIKFELILKIIGFFVVVMGAVVAMRLLYPA